MHALSVLLYVWPTARTVGQSLRDRYISCLSRSKFVKLHVVPIELGCLMFVTYICVVQCSTGVAVVYSD